MIRHSTHRRVHYRDTDQMGIVYHGVYLEYFETGRTEWLRSLGMPYSAMEECGITIVVLEAAVRYLRPALYDSLLEITAIIHQIGGVRLRIDYEIRDEVAILLATGHTLHAFANKATMRPIRPPREFLEALRGESVKSHLKQTHDTP